MARARSGQAKQNRLPGPAAAPEPAAPARNDHPTAEAPDTDRIRLMSELERDLDRILFRVMAAGGMPEVERQIRLCRRLLILGSPE
jgi:hypothetical protein